MEYTYDIKDNCRLEYYQLFSGALEVASDAINCDIMLQIRVMSVLVDLINEQFDIKT